ncbi:MAG: hypothetical protein ACOC93_01085, partial [Planctomycetota bacterium]
MTAEPSNTSQIAQRLATETAEATAEAARSRAATAYARQSRESQEEAWILQHLPLVKHIVA